MKRFLSLKTKRTVKDKKLSSAPWLLVAAAEAARVLQRPEMKQNARKTRGLLAFLYILGSPRPQQPADPPSPEAHFH